MSRVLFHSTAWLTIASLGIISAAGHALHLIPGCGHHGAHGRQVARGALHEHSHAHDADHHAEHCDAPSDCHGTSDCHASAVQLAYGDLAADADFISFDAHACTICQFLSKAHLLAGPARAVASLPVIEQRSASTNAVALAGQYRQYLARGPPSRS